VNTDKFLISSELIKVGIEDNNFATYFLLQHGVAIDLMKQTLKDFYNNKLKTFKKENVESNLYYHPTFFGYFFLRIFKRVK